MKRISLTFSDEEINFIKNYFFNSKEFNGFDLKNIILKDNTRFSTIKSTIDKFIEERDETPFSLKNINFGFNLSKNEMASFGKYISSLNNIECYKKIQGVAVYRKIDTNIL